MNASQVTQKILAFRDCATAVETYFLPEEKRLQGNPLQSLWPHYTDPTKQFFSGVWQSDIGKWQIHYTEEEFCQILEGISILTDAEGLSMRVAAGDNFIIPRGFHGTWEVLEKTRKIYVIYEAGNTAEVIA